MTDYSFENFHIKDKQSEQAYNLIKKAAFELINKEEPSVCPIYIYGPSGSGKTHLLKSFDNYVRFSLSPCNVIFISMIDFISELIKSMRKGCYLEYIQKYDFVDALLIDDIDCLENKEATTEQFIRLFNHLFEEKN